LTSFLSTSVDGPVSTVGVEVAGTEANDTLRGEELDDLLQGFGGDDILFGNAGDDELHGGAGNDQITAGIGNDRIFGGSYADTIWGNEGNDTIDAGSGLDQVFGGLGDDTIYGHWGHDTLDGGEGADRIDGGVVVQKRTRFLAATAMIRSIPERTLITSTVMPATTSFGQAQVGMLFGETKAMIKSTANGVTIHFMVEPAMTSSAVALETTF